MCCLSCCLLFRFDVDFGTDSVFPFPGEMLIDWVDSFGGNWEALVKVSSDPAKSPPIRLVDEDAEAEVVVVDGTSAGLALTGSTSPFELSLVLFKWVTSLSIMP